MINAEQITARLRMMSDADLQRFAEMNKKDPYLFPLAFNESNMRKKVRMAGAAQQAAPQPPVNEQAVAAMTPAQLPENQGIGMLNPNLQFADGGLVAFAAGGAPEDEYEANDDAYSGEMQTYAYGGAVRFQNRGEVPYGQGLTPYAPYSIGNPEYIAERKAKREKEQSEPESLEALRTRQAVLEAGLPWVAAASDIGTLAPRMARKVYDVGAKYINAFGGGLPREGAESAPFLNEIFPSFNALKAQEAQARAQAQAQAKEAAPAAAPEAATAPGPAPAPTPTPAPAIPRIAAPPPTNLVSDIRKLYGGAADEEQRIAEQRIADYQKGRPGPETFEERRKLLEESGADVEKQQRMDEGLAWLTFASKVMTPGMNPIQALVEGAAAGTSQYAAAQKDLKKAERERKMGIAALAEAQRLAERQDYDAVEAYKQKASERADNMRGAETSAIASAMNISFQEASQIRRDEINRAAAAANVQAQIASHERLAGLELEAKKVRAKLDSDAELMKSFTDFVSKNPRIQTLDLVDQYKAFNGVRALTSGNVQTQKEAPGTVLSRPKD